MVRTMMIVKLKKSMSTTQNAQKDCLVSFSQVETIWLWFMDQSMKDVYLKKHGNKTTYVRL